MLCQPSWYILTIYPQDMHTYLWITERLFYQKPHDTISLNYRIWVISVRQISDETLIDSYYKALDLRLESDFLELLLAEIQRRKLKLSVIVKDEAPLN
ncbi:MULTISPECIES: sporulation histidine kinase inhibitor Sda [Paenibacillus]|uniref:sporulation histidine kinase inhibitor Sda n=1 Tax=Paenibacillus TaxID=44249 RepID=UPI003B847E86